MSDYHFMLRSPHNYSATKIVDRSSLKQKTLGVASIHPSAAMDGINATDSESEDGMMEMEHAKYSIKHTAKKRSRSPSNQSRNIKKPMINKTLTGLEALASAAVMNNTPSSPPMPALDPLSPSSSASSSSSSNPPTPPPSVAPLSPTPSRLPSSQTPLTSVYSFNGVCICSACLPVDSLHPDVLIERLVSLQQRLPRNTKSDHVLASLQSLRYIPAEAKLKLPNMIKQFLATLAAQYFGINKHVHTRGLATQLTRPVAVPSPTIFHKITQSVRQQQLQTATGFIVAQ